MIQEQSSDQEKLWKLKPFQDNFLFSRKKFPAFISAWGTGKTAMGIQRALFYTDEINFNLGIIFRKEFTDLRDSTLKDFQDYTGLKVDSTRCVLFGNGSLIMFRHLEEMNNIQNLNLGWFMIDQVEELGSDEQFFKLWGRLRRKLNPSPLFKSLGLSTHSGFVVGNVAGNNWVKKLWKTSPKKDFSLSEATTYDNEENLPEEFIKQMDELKNLKPDIWRRFCMNDWDIDTEGKAIKEKFIDDCIGGEFEERIECEEYILGVDLAKYLDYTVIIVIRKSTKQVVFFDRFNETSWSLQKERIIEIARRYNHALIVPDSTGVGDPIVEDLERTGCRVYCADDSDRMGFVFSHKSKVQLIENMVISIEQKKVKYPYVQELIDELKDFEINLKSEKNIKYSAPEGRHDDCVIALALALWGIERNVEPNIFTISG